MPPSSEMNDDVEVCPKCGQEFDPMRDQLVECPRCGVEGSTACCNLGGRGVICFDCEDEDGADDIGKGVDDE